MDYLHTRKEWKSASFLIWLLKEQVDSIQYAYKNDGEFDKAFKEDFVMRKNLGLELKDITIIVSQLISITNKKVESKIRNL